MVSIMKFKILVFSFIFCGCRATLQKTEPSNKNIRTIGYNTGSLTDDGIYRAQFARGAQKECGSDNYKILEKSRKPSTLQGMELESSKYYWVIECLGDKT
jgi:hypothetical protein